MKPRPTPSAKRWQGAGLCLALLLSACASGPPAPEWQARAHSELQAFSQAYLRGNNQVAAKAFSRARSETASTGQAEQVSRAELTRCAVQVASLVLDDCPGYLALAPDSSPATRAYAQYLNGRWDGLDASQLPEQHRALVLQAKRGEPAPEASQSVLGAIADPLARLVAAGALLRSGHLTPADIATATETAAAQGWRRPLLAWLGVQRQRAGAAADGAPVEVARIQRRIDLVLQSGSVE
jgi:hypothetical protein